MYDESKLRKDCRKVIGRWKFSDFEILVWVFLRCNM